MVYFRNILHKRLISLSYEWLCDMNNGFKKPYSEGTLIVVKSDNVE